MISTVRECGIYQVYSIWYLGVDFNQLSYEVTLTKYNSVWTQGQVINADRT